MEAADWMTSYQPMWLSRIVYSWPSYELWYGAESTLCTANLRRLDKPVKSPMNFTVSGRRSAPSPFTPVTSWSFNKSGCSQHGFLYVLLFALASFFGTFIFSFYIPLLPFSLTIIKALKCISPSFLYWPQNHCFPTDISCYSNALSLSYTIKGMNTNLARLVDKICVFRFLS